MSTGNNSMKYHNSEIYHRRSIRLKDYDYSQPGAYFITITTHQRELLFGQITDGVMLLNQFGEIARSCWQEIPNHFGNVDNDIFIVMPNHVHDIIAIDLGIATEGTVPINRDAPTTLHAPTTESFGKPTMHSVLTIMRSFKSAVTKQINDLRHTPGYVVWQRGYYEHIIQTDDELDPICQYIQNNPAQWALDQDNPANPP
ncbi:MAG: transposase [Dehalococcoidia bacterium]|nr:transposase [Dehalococcoidia bacterium]